MVAMGVLKWIDYTVLDKSYFKLNTEQTPLHLVLLDEVKFNIELYIGYLYCYRLKGSKCNNFSLSTCSK